MVRKLVLAAALLMIAGTASAGHRDDQGDRDDAHDSDRHDMKAPEIDPSSAMAGLSLMAGGLVVLRGRRRIKTQA